MKKQTVGKKKYFIKLSQITHLHCVTKINQHKSTVLDYGQLFCIGPQLNITVLLETEHAMALTKPSN
jgi:hypothetical protein